MKSTLFCCDERRKLAVLGQSVLNGIDYLEVLDLAAPPNDRQRILQLHFINSPAPAGLTIANVIIEGGERLIGIQADSVAYLGDVLEIHLTSYGDYSPYVLRLVAPGTMDPLPGLDPLLAELEFSFKVECASDLDCRTDTFCPPQLEPAPDINYLAKDYESFRRLMLDRMTLLVPHWTERSAADFAIAFIEMLAYVGDHLSYQQDAVATEAYLGTARRRISVRRHARLVDYFMHDGCNARVWVHIAVNAALTVKRGSQLFTKLGDAPLRVPPPPGSHLYDEAIHAHSRVFETMHELALSPLHNQLSFYTWSDARCCLPAGETSATLIGHFPDLKIGDVLIFEELMGPVTGEPADADPLHRLAVRLVRADPDRDPLAGVDITEISWDEDDALPFPLCISAVTDASHGARTLVDVSVARGNVVLADHGRTIADEAIGVVPEPTRYRAPKTRGTSCMPVAREPVQPRFVPHLSSAPLTQTATVTTTELVQGEEIVHTMAFDPNAPAASAMRWQMQDVLPAIALNSTGAINSSWTARRDLLDSDPFSAEFVAEVDEAGIAHLRFGDGEYAIRPDPKTSFTATYRVGVGRMGNVGAETITRIVTNDPGIIRVRNPLPAHGGRDPEASEHVRQVAPVAFQTQKRAVTPADYVTVSQKRRDVLRAAAAFRWTGSWHTVFDSVDRPGNAVVDDAFEKTIRDYLENYRVVGRDLEVNGPIYVSLDIEMLVCVRPEYFRADVKSALLQIFNDKISASGARGLFYPDNFSFGQKIFVSKYQAAAQALDGVDSVTVKKFERQGAPSDEALKSGFIKLDTLEIARVENNPNFPEHGQFMLVMRGGK